MTSPDDLCLFGLCFFQASNVLLRDYQHVSRRLGIDVLERKRVIVLADFLCGNLSSNDFAEQAVRHGSSLDAVASIFSLNPISPKKFRLRWFWYRVAPLRPSPEDHFARAPAPTTRPPGCRRSELLLPGSAATDDLPGLVLHPLCRSLQFALPSVPQIR